MINLFHKNKGAATLVIAVILITLSALIIIFAANHGQMLEKITANQTRNTEAFSAAEAGLEFGINYFQQNAATILASPSGGYIQSFSNSNIANVSLANGSHFTVVYTNPVAANYNLIKVTSTGTNAEGSSTRVVSQLIAAAPLLSNPGTIPLVTTGTVSLSGNTIITNTSNNQTIQSGGTVGMSGNARTVLNSGTSSLPGNIKSDVQASQSTLQNMSQSNFIASFFSTSSSSSIQSKVAHYYTNSSNTSYNSTLNNMTGSSVWIDQTNGSTATISGNTVVGSITNPVLLIVNGNLSISGNTIIYGFIFVIGSAGIDSLSGNTQIIGGLAASANLTFSGNTNLTYNPTVLSNLQSQSSGTAWAKVAGTWKDF